MAVWKKWRWIRSAILSVTSAIALSQLPIFVVRPWTIAVTTAVPFFILYVALDQMALDKSKGYHKKRTKNIQVITLKGD